LLYTTETSDSNPKDKADVPALQLKIYERIPIPDLPVNTSDTAISVDAFTFCSSFLSYL
jgi:hypothetical protein